MTAEDMRKSAFREASDRVSEHWVEGAINWLRVNNPALLMAAEFAEVELDAVWVKSRQTPALYFDFLRALEVWERAWMQAAIVSEASHDVP